MTDALHPSTHATLPLTAALLAWQVRELLEIFPLRISALRSQCGPPLKVTICNLKVPEGGPASSSSWGEAEVSAGWLGACLTAGEDELACTRLNHLQPADVARHLACQAVH